MTDTSQNSTVISSNNAYFKQLQVNSFVLDGVGADLAVFFFLSVVIIFYWMNQLGGKILRTHLFLNNRPFHIISNPTLIKVVNGLLKAVVYVMVLFPLMIMAVWGTAIVKIKTDDNDYPIGGAALFLAASAFLSFSFGSAKLFWNNFRFTWEVSTALVFSFLLLMAYQLLVILYDSYTNPATQTSFFGYSCIFLNCNCVLVVVLIFLHTGKRGASIKDFLFSRLQHGLQPDQKRTVAFDEEIEKQRQDDNFVPTFEEVTDLFTLLSVSEQKVVTAFGGGIQQRFRQYSHFIQKLITFLLYGSSVGILIIYAFIIYWTQKESRLGFVIMIAILVTDVVLFLIYLSKIINYPLYLTITAIINRLMLIILGQEYWVYGLMIIFIYYGFVLAVVIGNKRFPFEDAFGDIDLDKIYKKRKEIDVSRIPEFLFTAITCIFAGVIGLLALLDPKGVPLPQLFIGKNNFHFYIVAIFNTLVIITFFALYTTFRLFIRKKREIRSSITFFFKTKRIDMYWMFIFLTFICLVLFSLLAYWATDEISFFIFGIFTTITIIMFLNALLHYAMNDYNILQDISALNAKINKHNSRIVEINKKKLQFKKDLMAGNAQIGQMGLAQGLLEKKKKENEIKKQAKEAMNQSSILGPGSPNKSSTNLKISQTVPLTKFASNNSNNPAISQQQPTSQANSSLANKKKLSKEEEDDNMIREELKKEVDGIYEGGEDEQKTLFINQQSPSNLSGNNLSQMPNLSEIEQIKQAAAEEEAKEEENGDPDDDSDNEMVDPEMILENQEESGHLINKQMSNLYDWRKEGVSVVTAYFKGKLRKNDYQIISSLAGGFLSLIILAVLICVARKDWVGITIAVPILHYTLAALSFVRVLNTTEAMSIGEMVTFFLSYCIQYGWGVAYLFIKYDKKHMVKDPVTEKAPAGPYIVIYLLVIPFITSSLFASLKWLDDKKFSPMMIGQLVLTILQATAILICSFVYLKLEAGFVIIGVVAFILYISLIAYIYHRNNQYMPKLWKYINLTVGFLVGVTPGICGIVLKNFLAYIGFSISIWVFCFFAIIYAVISIASDLRNSDKRPIFFSPMIFPVYKFDPKKNDISQRNAPAAALFIALLTMICWSASCTVWVSPYYIGVSLSIAFQLLLLTVFLFLISITQIEIQQNQDFIDNLVIKSAWLDAKDGYINARQATNRNTLVTYELAKKRRDDFRNYIRLFEGRRQLTFEEILSNVMLETTQEIDKQFLQSLNIDLTSSITLYSTLFQIERHLSDTYMAELELIIMFLLLMLQQAENVRERERKLLFNFLNEKKPALFALGIVINIPEEGNLAIRYARVVKQIANLQAEKQTMFKEFREQYNTEKFKKEQDEKEQEKLENEKQKSREAQMSKEDEVRLQLIAQVETNWDIEKMPDCQIKYDKILKTTLQSKEKYTDNDFPPNDTSLGDHVRNFAVAKWKRASDDPLCSLYFDGANCQDIQQGRLGDCYLLSAISVLGSSFIMDKVILTKTEEQWKESGAFHLMFYRNGSQYEVIIDDWFPVTGAGEWVFVRGGSKNIEHPMDKNKVLYGKEIWPMVIEKGYAKLYKSFSNIENGKLQYALADLTNGYPEQINLKTDGKNTQILWERLKTYYSHGDLLGAGSSNPSRQGDTAISELGIVEGHAYAIIRVEEVDGNRLLQLRNPHGELSTCEWSGDWCDDSLKWNSKMRKVLNYYKTVSKDADEVPFDGIFWMDISDFVSQFGFLYICRTLSEKDGWKKAVCPDEEWIPSFHAGVPSPENPQGDLMKNPQYTVTLHKPCDGFIVVKQRDVDPTQSFKGKQAMFFTVCKTDGKLIKALTKQNAVCRSGPLSNLVVQTSQIEFDRTVSYPYSFTLLVANNRGEDEGRGRFKVTVCAKTDGDFKLTRLNPIE